MKKHTFIALFITLHLTFMTLKIHLESLFIENSYKKQRLEQELEKLYAHIQALKQKKAELSNPAAVKQFVSTELGMEPVKRNQIIKLSS